MAVVSALLQIFFPPEIHNYKMYSMHFFGDTEQQWRSQGGWRWWRRTNWWGFGSMENISHFQLNDDFMIISVSSSHSATLFLHCLTNDCQTLQWWYDSDADQLFSGRFCEEPTACLDITLVKVLVERGMLSTHSRIVLWDLGVGEEVTVEPMAWWSSINQAILVGGGLEVAYLLKYTFCLSSVV